MANEIVKNRRQQQYQESQAQQNKLEATRFVSADSTTQQSDASVKRVSVFKDAIISLVVANLPIIERLLVQLGLPSIKELQNKTVDEINALIQSTACQNQETLQQVLKIRNALNDILNPLANNIQLTQQALDGATAFLAAQIDSVTLIKLIKNATSATLKVLPPGTVPGALPSLLSDTQAIIDFLLFTALGNPKLEKIQTSLYITQNVVASAAISLKKLLIPLSILDQLLAKCNQPAQNYPAALDVFVNTYIPKSSATATDLDYKGFRLVVEEEPFSELLTKKKAVAYNISGIAVLETESSFTSLPQILLDQLKYTIDIQNLKAS